MPIQQSLSRRHVLALIACSMVWLGASVRAADKPASEPKTVRLLTVGNSFSNNATKYLSDLAKADGNTLVHQACAIGGASLEKHWTVAQAHEKDPKDPAGLYAGKTGLKEALKAQPWDFITIQQASIKSHDVATYRPFAKQLHDYIKAAAPNAEIVMHQTWAYRVDDPRFAPKKQPAAKPAADAKPAAGAKTAEKNADDADDNNKSDAPKTPEPKTQREMYEQLTAAYKTIAVELGVRRLPVGDAFYAADTDPKWGYQPDTKFDPKTAVKPALPDQEHSLHTGRTWRTGKDGQAALAMDGHHANAAGQYLAACVWYEVMFKRDVTANAFVPKGIDAEYAKFLRQTAHAAVEKAKSEASGRPARELF